MNGFDNWDMMICCSTEASNKQVMAVLGLSNNKSSNDMVMAFDIFWYRLHIFVLDASVDSELKTIKIMPHMAATSQ
jgi:hypothetical protein